ncbi:MAG: hypothetical protein RJA44_1462 [Pseudomonadota bacterium]
MKILISGVYGASKWQHPFFAATADALEQLGHEVHRFHAGIDAAAPTAGQKLLERSLTGPARLLGIDKRSVKQRLPWTTEFKRHQALLEAVTRHRPEILIVITYVRYPAEVLRQCRDLGVRTLVGWFVEGPQHEYDAESEAPLYDRYFCIHRNLKADWQQRIAHLPAIALNATEFHPLQPAPPRREQIVFVGNRTERRARYLAALHDLPLQIWGPGGWDQDPALKHAFRSEFIWGPELNALYNQSAIVLNISTWDPGLSGLTQRVLDVPASGTFLLTDESADLRALPELGRHIATFETPEQLRAQCLHYLAEPQQRDEIAVQAYRAALAFPDFKAIATRLIHVD